MTLKRKQILFIACSLILLIVTSIASISTTSAVTYQDTLDEITNVRKNSIYNLELNAPFSKDTSGVREVVNPETGALSVEYKLFTLAGRGGVNSFDLSLEYFSPYATDMEESAEYSEKNGYYINSNVSKSTLNKTIDHFGIGWRMKMPYVEKPDERNKSIIYVHLPDGAVYKQGNTNSGFEDYGLEDVKFDVCSETINGVEIAYRLSYIDGRKYYFRADGLVAESVDKFGNKVTYCWSDGEISVIEKIYDNSGDVIEFTYQNNNIIIKHHDRRYIILCEQKGESHIITSVTDPQDRKTEFSYCGTALYYNFRISNRSEDLSNTYYLLDKIKYNTGAYTCYEYTISKKWLNENTSGTIEYPKIEKRYDVIGDENLSVQTYYYYLEPDGCPTYTSKQIPKDYFYYAEVTDITGGKTKYVYDKEHNQTKLVKTVNGKTISEEIRKYRKTDQMPEQFIVNTYNASGNCKTVFTDYVFDKRGNAIYTDSYQNAEDKGKRAQEYQYSSINNICIYESMYQDEETKVEIKRTLNPYGNNIASEAVLVNGTQIKKDFFTYDKTGNIIEEKMQTDELNYVKMKYAYSGETYHQYPEKITVTGVRNADGDIDTYTYRRTYDEYGNCIEEENPDGNCISYTYDSLNRVTKEVLEDGAYRETVYDNKNNIITKTDANGIKLLYYYDKCGKLNSVYDTKSNVYLLKRTYDAKERLATETDSRGTKYCYSYDNLDRYTELTVYDESGTLLSEKYLSYNEAKDFLGGQGTLLTLEEGEISHRRKTEYLFDYLDRLIQVVQYDGDDARITNYEYDLAGNNTVVTSPNGTVTYNEYDCFGNNIKTLLPDGTENVFTFDLLGNVTSETNGAGETVFYTYDGLSRLTRTESTDGERVSVERTYYDFRGNIVKTLDANNNKTLYSYTKRGFLDTVKQYENATDGQKITYAYDGEGNITKMSIGAIGSNQRHTYKYGLDAYGRMISETDPENGVATYEYDTEGNLISLRNKNGVTTSYTYDGLGRILKQTNSKSGTLSYKYNDFGEVTQITDGTMSVVNKYNSFGEVIETIRNSSSETYTYDNEGRVTTHISKDKDMGEVKTSYIYDVLGRTTSIVTGAGAENIAYDNAGRIAKKTIDSQGVEKRYSYYKNGLLKSVNTYRNEKLINTENSEYDLSGNKTLEETDGNVKRYAYDGLNRLKSVIENNGDQTEYEFDSFGNISKEYTLTPGDIKTRYYHYDNANRLILMYDDKSSGEYTYDAEGNMLTKVSDAGGRVTTSNYVYDGYNRLSEFYSQNTEAQYSYNPEGLRESKTVNGNTTRFLYNDGNIIGEFMEDDYYIYHRGTELIGYTSFSGKTANYQQDSHGNVTALLSYDGTELKTYTYNAYGKEQAFTANPEGSQTILYQWKNETDSTHNPFRYCGEYQDLCSGLIYLRNRYYDPSIGRFISEDPARDGLNWYVYCRNNPVNYIDPLGLAPSVMEAALMADHVYNHNWDEPINNRRIYDADGNYTGWRMIDMFTQGTSKIGVYVRGDGKDSLSTYTGPMEYVLSYKGTKPTSVEDWKNNAQQFIGEYSEHLVEGMVYTSWFVDSKKDYEITFTGHSKGGGEAAVNAEFWNKNAIVFNPSVPDITWALADDGYVKPYVVTNEILNYVLGEIPLGTTKYLKQQHNGWLPGTTTLDRINNHGMEAVIAGLIQGGY